MQEELPKKLTPNQPTLKNQPPASKAPILGMTRDYLTIQMDQDERSRHFSLPDGYGYDA